MKPAKRTLLRWTLAVTLIAVGAVAGQAKTPDGETPAVEDVCDELSGAAFGLCNAYCEAMDCDLRDDDDPNTRPAASVKACLKTKDNFIKITGLASFPCEGMDEQCPNDDGQVDCMCSSDEDCARGLMCDDGFCAEG